MPTETILAHLAALPARALAFVLLWAPTLLWLTVSVPVEGGLPLLHLVTASALAFVLERILHVRYALRTAPAADGRYRVLPRNPQGAQLRAAMASAVLGYAAWRALRFGASWLEWLALPAAGLIFWGAGRMRADPIWGSWLEVRDGILHVHGMHRSYTVPVGQVLRLRYRERDGSFLVQTPWPDRDTLVLSAAARGRYLVEGASELFGQLAEHCEVEEARGLVSAGRRMR